MCKCAIDELRIKPFSSCSFEDKHRIVENGRPTPDLDIQKVKKGKGCYSFQKNWYIKNEWLCGCGTTQSLYCWPCSLFSGQSSSWTTKGITDVTNFSVLRKRHIVTSDHIICLSKLMKFGQTRMKTFLSRANKLSIQKHNDNVRNNRYVLTGMIDAVCYLARQENDDSGNRENYVELLQAFAKRDKIFANHLDQSTVFSGSSTHDMQNDLISAIYELMINHIKSEVATANFVSVVLDETTDVTHKRQLATVLRFVTDEVHERFLGFTDSSGDRTAAGLMVHIEETLQNYNCGNKLVCQTYDGASVISGEHNGLQKIVRDKYPAAIFVHCYAHKLNLVLQQATSSINACRVFFQTCNGLSAFFSKSITRLNALEEAINLKFPSVPTRWVSSRFVSVLCKVKEQVAQLLMDMGNDEGSWDHETRIMARGYSSTIREPTFRFLLSLFSIILPKANILSNILQKKINDLYICQNEIKNFVVDMQNLKDDFDSVWNCQGYTPQKRLGMDEMTGTKTSYRVLLNEVIDTVILQINERFENFDELDFLPLLDPETFSVNESKFPHSSFQCLKNIYNIFDFDMLKTELEVVYSDPDYRGYKSLAEFHEFLCRSGVGRALPEVVKLASLILTIPAISASADRSFSALERIHTYKRNTQSEFRNSHFGVISIEQRLLNQLCQDPLFYDKVIDIFAKQKDRSINLFYK